ncbi:MAG: hypothetical protein LBQ66_02700, partial [Planctomycetaceae bacterium]|nr:hypothetical protein [Planctomycetaceae bacterium]
MNITKKIIGLLLACVLLSSCAEKSTNALLIAEQGSFAFMQKLKETGKARRIGFSFHDKAEVPERIEY